MGKKKLSAFTRVRRIYNGDSPEIDAKWGIIAALIYVSYIVWRMIVLAPKSQEEDRFAIQYLLEFSIATLLLYLFCNRTIRK